MPVVPVGPLQIAYHDRGAGDPVLLLNGTGESGRTWLPLVEPLAERWRFVALDQRDTGASTYVADPYTPADLAEDALGVIDALGLGPCHVAGFSLGGAAAQELALGHPDAVSSLVLLSTWARSDAWFVAQMRSWQAIRKAHADERAFIHALDAWLLSPSTFDDRARYEQVHALWDDDPDQRPDGFLRQCEADIAHDAEDRLRDLDVPTLILVGEDDICTPPRYARALHRLLPRSRLSVIPGAGHCLPFERPGAVRAEMLEFLDRG